MKKLNLSILGSYTKKTEFLINYIYNLSISKGIKWEDNTSISNILTDLIDDNKLREFPIILVIQVTYLLRYYVKYLLSDKIYDRPIYSNFEDFVKRFDLDDRDKNSTVGTYIDRLVFDNNDFKESGYNFKLSDGELRIVYDGVLGFGNITFNVQVFDRTLHRYKHICSLFVEPTFSYNNKILLTIDLYEYGKETIVLEYNYEDLPLYKIKDIISKIVFNILKDEYIKLIKKHIKYESTN